MEFYLYVVIASLMLVFAHIRGLFWMLVSMMISSIAGYLLMREGATESQYVDVLRGFAGFFAGVFVYEIRRYLMTLDMRAKALGLICNATAVSAVIAAVVLLNRDGFAPYVWGYPIFAILVLSLSLLPDKHGVNRLLTAKLLLWLGQISYSLYMVHQALFWGFKQFMRVVLHAPQIIVHGQKMLSTSFWIGQLLLIGAVSLTLACAHLSYRYVEDRYRRKSRAIAELYFSEAASDQLASRSTA